MKFRYVTKNGVKNRAGERKEPSPVRYVSAKLRPKILVTD
ncbi:hypothetical protein COLO4_27579 [Corchorus olitorius]|uniref:Uncharacterized protein n=1 Tax=Corchorus olitorius TaxID=93759 RepID=A0A1R3HQ62_9ROSI|nr:hypothetical protein COLO4_27579 [Corchorus olitorius]